MRIRFQADADLDGRIIRGLKRREPEIDMQTAVEGGLPGLSDTEVLLRSAEAGRLLVTHDHHTMPMHFASFLAGRQSAGVFIIPKHTAIRDAIEELLLIRYTTEHHEWANRLVWIPL